MIVVSSAKRIKLKSVLAFTKSLMYVRKRRGPRIDPWGTPVVIWNFDCQNLHIAAYLKDMMLDRQTDRYFIDIKKSHY